MLLAHSAQHSKLFCARNQFLQKHTSLDPYSGRALRKKVLTNVEELKAQCSLHTAVCNVVRSRVQRCPRPWTTLYTASCDGKKELRYGEVPCRYRGRAAGTYKMRHGCRRWNAGVNKKDAVRKRPAYMSILQPTCAYVFTRHQPDASSFSHAKPCRA